MWTMKTSSFTRNISFCFPWSKILTQTHCTDCDVFQIFLLWQSKPIEKIQRDKNFLLNRKDLHNSQLTTALSLSLKVFAKSKFFQTRNLFGAKIIVSNIQDRTGQQIFSPSFTFYQHLATSTVQRSTFSLRRDERIRAW